MVSVQPPPQWHVLVVNYRCAINGEPLLLLEPGYWAVQHLLGLLHALTRQHQK